ncbi:hypothetical protein Q31a_60920 [Aureliella helgolandensis]|uniref:Uncharacterized protein n=1 Tax=Aureliella helgolandensis TaxID=2527968 RepID=A0A518GGI6_9BACT|nr:hypothetical protein Q31a_60920 [Aureliella helgolandensis]
MQSGLYLQAALLGPSHDIGVEATRRYGFSTQLFPSYLTVGYESRSDCE